MSLETKSESPPGWLRRVASDLSRPRDDNVVGSTWRSLCFQCDSRAVVFFSRLLISIMVLIFCMYRLSVLTECSDQQGYVGLLTFVCGTWVSSIISSMRG